MRKASVAISIVFVCGALSQAAILDHLYKTTGQRNLATKIAVNDGSVALSNTRYYTKSKQGYKSETFGSIKPVGERSTFNVEFSTVSPALAVTTDAAALDVFSGASRTAKRKTVPVSPKFVAFSSGGAVVVKRATEKVALQGMDKPWLLTWWGSAPAPGGPHDTPMLIVLQNRAKSVHASTHGLHLRFKEKAGTVIVMPLEGRFTRSVSQTKHWAQGLPEDIAKRCGQWAGRLRMLPMGVSESYAVNPEGVEITETFTFKDIDDAWKTPKQAWAFIPPIFGLTYVNKGPIVVGPQAKVVRWMGVGGPLVLVDGERSISFTIRIPQLGDYLWKRRKVVDENLANPKYQVLRKKLRREIDRMLAGGEHYAPLRFLNGKEPTLTSYWGNPAETIVSLLWAMPFLEKNKQEQLKEYVRKEVEAFDPLKIGFVAKDTGLRREFWEAAENDLPKSGGAAEGPPSPYNIYAAAQYIEEIGTAENIGPSLARAKALVAADAKDILWDLGESTGGIQLQRGLGRFANLNARLAGYIGYARLARLARDKDAQAYATCLLARGLAIKYAHTYYQQYLNEHHLNRSKVAKFPKGFFCKGSDFCGTDFAIAKDDGLGVLRTAGTEFYNNYLFCVDLVPETGQFMYDYCREPTTVMVNYMEWRFPGHHMSKSGYVYRMLNRHVEEKCIQPWNTIAGFLAQSLAVQRPADELCWYVGDPVARVGDLYYIQKLAFALRAFGQ